MPQHSSMNDLGARAKSWVVLSCLIITCFTQNSVAQSPDPGELIGAAITGGAADSVGTKRDVSILIAPSGLSMDLRRPLLC